jgi:hypothetical protein
MRVGYARVSTLDQSSDLQYQALTAAGGEKVFGEKPLKRDVVVKIAARAVLAGPGIGLFLVIGLLHHCDVDAFLDDAAQGFFKAFAPVGDKLAHGLGLLVGQCDGECLRHGLRPGWFQKERLPSKNRGKHMVRP